MSIFDYLDYSKWLREFVHFRKTKDSKFTLSKVAELIGVQKAYLSKVCQGNAHLSSDQIYLLATSLNFSETEFQYLRLIHEYSRTGLATRKEDLRAQIEALREETQDARENLDGDFLEPDVTEKAAYFMDPYSSVVHMLLTIDHFQKNPNLIHESLNVSAAHVDRIIESLKKLGFIEWRTSEQRFQILKQHIIIHKSSPLAGPHQALVRTLSASQIMKLAPEEYQTFSLTLSMDDATQQKLRASFLEWLKTVQELVVSAPAEEAYQLNFDLFPWSRRNSR